MKQPFLYAVAFGALVFALDYALTKELRAIVVTGEVSERVTLNLKGALGRTPSPQEIEVAIQAWQDDEVLYREALALDLGHNDPVVRTHLVSKLRKVVRERAISEPPSDAELEALFEADRHSYETESSYDVTLGYFANHAGSVSDARARAESALAELQKGQSPKEEGAHFPRGPEFPQATRKLLEQTFQADLGALLGSTAPGPWQMVVGARGFFVLKLTQVHSGVPSFENSRPALVARFEELQKQRALDAFIGEAKRKYDLDSPDR